jgi:hypothetical protein
MPANTGPRVTSGRLVPGRAAASSRGQMRVKAGSSMTAARFAARSPRTRSTRLAAGDEDRGVAPAAEGRDQCAACGLTPVTPPANRGHTLARHLMAGVL